jgi:hypothetical protein
MKEPRLRTTDALIVVAALAALQERREPPGNPKPRKLRR